MTSQEIDFEICRLEDNLLKFEWQQKHRQRVRNIKDTLSLILLLTCLYLLISPIFASDFSTQEKIVVYHGQVAVQLPIPVVSRYSGVYEFVGPGAWTFGYGQRRATILTANTGSMWFKKVCSTSSYAYIHGECSVR